MNYSQPQILTYGEQALLIRWEPEMKPHLLARILNAKDRLERHYSKTGIPVEIINAYHEILIHFKEVKSPDDRELEKLKAFLSDISETFPKNRTLYHLPVCYEAEFALDIEYMEEEKGLSREEIIQMHTAPEYLLYFIGFLPGFLYLGGMDSRLQMDRKGTPREKIPKGAVGIAGIQTGIYPQASPGGWQIIGNCPVPLFHVHQNPPSYFKPGDIIRFFAISKKEHARIGREIKKYQIKKKRYGD